jgi:hypothetical protein
MKLTVPSIPPLAFRLGTGFTGVNELDLSSFGSKLNSRLLDAVATLSGLRSLNLADNKMGVGWTSEVMTGYWASLKGLTYLSLAKTDVKAYDLAALAHFLPSLTHLDLNECTEITMVAPNLKWDYGWRCGDEHSSVPHCSHPS